MSINWNEIRPAGNSDYNWKGVSMSANGSVVLAAVVGGRIYLSTDSGANFTELSSPAGGTNRNWIWTAVSGDGAVQLAGGAGFLYVSTDSGVNWALNNPSGVRDYQGGVVSKDGSWALVGSNTGTGNRVWRYEVAEDDWTTYIPVAAGDWRNCLGISDDGSVMVAGNYPGRLYLSTDNGANWSEIQPLGNNDSYWNGAAVASDNQTIIVGQDDTSHLYKSINQGSTWSDIFTDPDSYLNMVKMSSDGTQMMALSIAGSHKVYLSNDSGVSFINETPVGVTVINTIALARDKNKFVVGGNRLYYGNNITRRTTGPLPIFYKVP